ncbi:SIR2 family protein [Stutzerimonas nitrititolerans]|uniref:SIR2 family protein n=1 Tax=Stutzerimonas nitrititolerans TaxID=2482751 RepID=UPI0015E3C893|nr:SIR2 family protein [Stutzerimonas nitrititolerans]MBA1183518.1 Sir2 family NAD-dependent protein deacetylase [Stutzerimonas stutzeri]
MDKLREAYRNNRLILFVGSGVSANIGLPPWRELIDEIATQLDYDPEVFDTYGNFLALAEYYRIRKGNIGPLRSWMDREWHRDIEIRDSEIHRLIVQGRFPAIYTTNYDRWLENAHDAHEVDYIKIANASDLVKAQTGVRQIVKFHGDFDDDDSIVLDETSYYERLQFETPLDIKLRADTLSKAVLFIGYSLSDTNIRLLFYKLSKMWNERETKGVRPISYVFSHKPNPVQQEILSQWGIRMIASEDDQPGLALQRFLEDLVEGDIKP